MLTRRTHTKSRQGCSECKRRKVKCNEQKPICEQCSRRRLVCSYAGNLGSTRNASKSHSIRTSVQESSPQAPLTHAINSSFDAPIPDVEATASQNSLSRGTNSLNAVIPDGESPLSNRGQPEQGYARTIQQLSLDVLDLEIFHTLVTSLPAEMKSTPASNSQHFWASVVPGLAFEHEFILHLSLAFAAQFMVQHQMRTVPALSLRAVEHYQLALPSLIQRLDKGENVQILWIGSLLLSLHYFARGPQAGEYLLFSDEEEPEWYGIFRGSKTVWELSATARPTPDQPAPLLYDPYPRSAPNTPGSVPISEGLPPSVKSRHAYFFLRLQQFRELLDTLTVEDDAYRKYLIALDSLELSYVEQYGIPPGYSRSTEVQTKSTFSWLYRVADDFIAALQAKKSVALVIFGFYVPILHDGQPRWLTDHWGEHILAGIQKHVHPHYNRWLEWVVEYLQSRRQE